MAKFLPTKKMKIGPIIEPSNSSHPYAENQLSSHLSLSLYIYMYTFMGTAVRSSDLWTRIIKHHAIMYVHCHHLNQVVGKHNTSEACEITGESVHGRNMGSPQHLCLHGFRIPWKVVGKRCTGMYSEGSISHAKGNKSIYLEHF